MDQWDLDKSTVEEERIRKYWKDLKYINIFFKISIQKLYILKFQGVITNIQIINELNF